MKEEPFSVSEARRKIREWELRNGHAAYTEPLDGGFRGYQAACFDCDWRGTEFLRGAEEMGTEESRAHKHNAWHEADQHKNATVERAGQPAPFVIEAGGDGDRQSGSLSVRFSREELRAAVLSDEGTTGEDYPDAHWRALDSFFNKLHDALREPAA